MLISGHTPDPVAPPPADLDVVTLHWMKLTDRAMHATTGIAVPTLCGDWVEPEPSDPEADLRPDAVRYVDCCACDVLYSLRLDAMTA